MLVSTATVSADTPGATPALAAGTASCEALVFTDALAASAAAGSSYAGAFVKRDAAARAWLPA